MDELLASIRAKKAELDRLRSRAPEGLTNLDHARDLDLTCTSNASRATPTAAETTIVIEQAITVACKPLKDLRLRPLRARIGAAGDAVDRDGHPRIA